MHVLIYLVPLLAIAALAFAAYKANYVSKMAPGSSRMQEISSAIAEGASAFLKSEYKILAVFILVLFILIAVFINLATALCFVAGAGCSILAGFFGMRVATKANVRTANAALEHGMNRALSVAFSGGSVMGMCVVGLGLLGCSLIYILTGRYDILFGFSLGASSIALFARVGGGIYTKAADVGADLVGKVEAGIPEDDPRNPAVIADNVGDNVGDVAGMGADLFESYVGAIVSAITLGVSAVGLFTGAGVSADSGLATFRDSDGTWGNYRIEEVCIPEALDFNRRGVIRFYNERRAEMLKAEPNAAHRAIAGLERDFDVRVITQNVDNLHERAGSTHILHLHGELTKLRSTDDPSLILPFDGVEQGFDDRAPDGSLLRPHIVFFGEPVPEFDRAAELAAGADILMVVGTSLAVYPAASLVRCVRPDIPVYVVDPGRPAIRGVRNPLEVIRKRAAEGVPELADRLRAACAEGRSESLLPGKA